MAWICRLEAKSRLGWVGIEFKVEILARGCAVAGVEVAAVTVRRVGLRV